MNKLAVLAFTLLLMLSAMSWFLAKSSVNDYLKSQTILQGHYYSGQQTSVDQAIFSAEKNTATFLRLTLANLAGYMSENALIIDAVNVTLTSPKDTSQPQELKDGLRTSQIVTLSQVTLNTVTINIEQNEDNVSNLSTLLSLVTLQLAKDYPALYPELAAKLYAEKNPDLNAELITQQNTEKTTQPLTDVPPVKEEINKAILASKEDKRRKKLLGKAQTRIAIQAVEIKNLVLNITNNGKSQTYEFHHLPLGKIGGSNGLASNQVGGELLRLILETTQELAD